MKKYTVQARCELHPGHKYTLRHDGEKWTEQYPYEETGFESREDAERFADAESASFEVNHEMVIVAEDEGTEYGHLLNAWAMTFGEIAEILIGEEEGE